MRVVLSGRSFPARVVGSDRSHDLSLLGFAVPIDTALAVAHRIQAAHSQ